MKLRLLPFRIGSVGADASITPRLARTKHAILPVPNIDETARIAAGTGLSQGVFLVSL